MLLKFERFITSSKRGSLKSLINAHVVHSHVLRKSCRGIWVTWPLANNGNVQNEEERIVKRIVLIAADVVVDTKKGPVVQEPGNSCFISSNGKKVKFIRKRLTV